jgi:hypothetical protein
MASNRKRRVARDDPATDIKAVPANRLMFRSVCVAVLNRVLGCLPKFIMLAPTMAVATPDTMGRHTNASGNHLIAPLRFYPWGRENWQ